MRKADIVKDAINRFPTQPIRTIARYLLHSCGEQFDGDIEKIRASIRYYTGRIGRKNRDNARETIDRPSRCKIPPTWRKKRPPYKLNPGLWLILSDVHIPFHEPKPLEAAIKYGQAEKVTGILLNGDIQDCAAVSFWPSAHPRKFDQEIELVIDFLDFLEKEFPNAEKVYKPGNHEYRLPRYYQAKAPELIGMPLLAMDTVLGLGYRKIEFLDYKQIVMAGKLPILHGDEIRGISTPVNPARGLALKAKTWAACAHFHRTSEHSTRDLNGKLLTTWSFGCLCDISPDYSPYNDWNWGFGLVNVEKDGNFEVSNRRVLPNGVVV